MVSRRSVLVAVVCGAAMAGCGESTGVLIEVSRDESVPADIGRLAFHVGIDGVIPDDPTRFVDPSPEADIRLDGRDLAEDPYRLLIRPREHPDADVMVAVIAYDRGEVVGFGALDQPVGFVDGEVAMWPVVLGAELPAGFGSTDTGCVTWVTDAGDSVTIGRPRDQDCDGWTDDDCNDVDPDINPAANETCGNDIDEDCDQQADENVDEDSDLVTTCDGDCNDRDERVSPAAEEQCDGIDNNCDAQCDEGHDGDGDTFTGCATKIVDGGTACVSVDKADCDDFDADVSPGAAEVCDGADNDCSGICDDSTAGLDRDGDGFTDCGSLIDHCGLSDFYIDCDDRDGEVHPGAPEVCDGVDNDCDGERLQRAPCFAPDPNQAGTCFSGERDCAEQDGDPGDWSADCQPRNGPLDAVPPEVCDAYAGCETVGSETRPDAASCALESSGLPLVGCSLSYQVSVAQSCGEGAVVLPIIGEPPLCTWAVVGGVEQGDYSVGLRDLLDPDGTPQPSLEVCGAALVVTTRVGGLPGPATVLIARTDPTVPATEFITLFLTPELVDACEPSAELLCQDFPP
jgi:hypothetical protein